MSSSRRASSADHLLVLTTCSRPEIAARHASVLYTIAESATNIDLAVSIDGLAEPGGPETLQLVKHFSPLIVAARRAEGVGVSKNRVLRLLPDYRFYSFIEDDVEVVDHSLFADMAALSQETGIHHFSLHEPERLRDEFGQSHVSLESESYTIQHAWFGSAQISFFTSEALDLVGGWHKAFAALRRGGHTEHSYRVYRTGLCPAPFNYIKEFANACRWHNPDSVVGRQEYAVAPNQLFELENELIAENLPKQPLYATDPGQLITR